jgi:flavin reductase (DIM6/NTAB) family NADH-FMN oxidoreductase RutF
MTIHSTHPFVEPEEERDPVRRFRGRLGGTVSVWTSGSGPSRTGLTVSSLMVVHGDPGHVLGLVDPDSDLGVSLVPGERFVVQLLEWGDRDLADAFAGIAPAPGGVFTLGTWADTEWGPLLESASAWAGVRVEETREVGWSMVVDGVVEHVSLGQEEQPLVHRRGRYVRPA